MAKVVLYIAQSLDGYIARPDGNLDWLTSTPPPSEGDYGYAALLERIDTIIMGRKTYHEIIGFGMEWPYSGFNTYVVTSNKDLKIESTDTFTASEDPMTFIRDLKETTAKDIWLVGGGNLIRSFLEHQLIDEMIISVIPKMIGSGIPLFSENFTESNWKLVEARSFDTGVLNLTYQKAE